LSFLKPKLKNKAVIFLYYIKLLIQRKMVFKNFGIILLGVVVFASIVLIILIFVERKVKKKVLTTANILNRIYIEKLAKLDPATPEITLKNVDKLARNFFREAFRIKPGMEYSELKEEFKKRNNKKVEEFCTIIGDLLYAGKKPYKKDNQKIINLLAEIIEKNKIISKQEKEELDKQSVKIEKGKKSLVEKILKKKSKKKEKQEINSLPKEDSNT